MVTIKRLITTSILLVMLCQLSYGQSFFVKTDTVRMNSSTDIPAELIYNYLYNLTADTLNMGWAKTKNDLPKGWYSSVCDEYICHDSDIKFEVFKLAPYDSTYLVGHFVYSDVGEGVLDITVNDLNDTITPPITLTYILTVSTNTDVHDALSKNMSVYPNPSKGMFRINPTGMTSGNLSVRDQLGNLVFEQKWQASNTSPITLPGTLSNGVYVLQVASKNKRFTSLILLGRD